MPRLPAADLPADQPIHNNLVRAMYRNPVIFKDFGRLAMRVHTASHLTTRMRELALLRVVARLGADYEWGNHVPGARQAGVTDDELRGLRAGDLSGFSAGEAAAIRLAEAVDDAAVTDELWNAAAQHLSEDELLDLVLVIGFYGFASRFVLALDVDLDDGVQGLDHP